MVWSLPALVVAMATPRVSDVALFQNGYALVRREVDVTASGEIRIETLPQAVLGTFRFSSTSGVVIQSVATDEEVTAQSDTTDDINELLSLNVGRRVTLLLTDNRTLEGEIVRASGTSLVFKEGTRERTMPRSLVREIVSDAPLSRATQRRNIARTLRIRYTATQPGKVVIRSLEPGLGWVPSYEAVVEDEGTLRLIGRATLENDLTNLDASVTELVTGVSNIRFARWQDPLIGLPRATPTFDRRAGINLQGGQGLVGESIDFISYDPTDNSLVVRPGEAPSPTPTSPMPEVGQSLGTTEELFRHRIGPVTLGRGARVQYSLFEARAPYREVFTWEANPAESAATVWRTLRFTNPAGRPLAPGPVTTFRDDRILGQDALRMTPANGETELRLTHAADVQAQAVEMETSRVEEPKTRTRAARTRATIEGTLQLTNGKDRPVRIQVRRQFLGQVAEDGGATVKRSAQDLRQSDPVTELTWTIDLPTSQTRTLTYTYRALVP